MSLLRILIADDFAVVRRGLAAILESRRGWTVVAEVATGREAVRKAKELGPDLVVLDINMPELNGLEAMGQILKSNPGTKVLIFTEDESEGLAQEAVKKGAMGYLFKSDRASDLLAAVESLSQNKPFFNPQVLRMVVEEYRKAEETGRAPTTGPTLSSREREVLQLVAEGKSSKEIAAILGVSSKTVDTHRSRIMRRLNIHSVIELVRYAIRNHIIRP